MCRPKKSPLADDVLSTNGLVLIPANNLQALRIPRMSLCHVPERGGIDPTLSGPLPVLPRNPFFNLLDRSVLHPNLDCHHSKKTTFQGFVQEYVNNFSEPGNFLAVGMCMFEGFRPHWSPICCR